MKIIGFDYDTKQTAWGIIKNGKIGAMGYFKYASLKELFSIVEEELQKHQPWMIAIEGLYLQSNPRVLTSLANIQGILRLAAYRLNGCEASIITPEAAKRAIGIDVYNKPYRGGKAKEKKQLVIDRVDELFNINLNKTFDSKPDNNEHIADSIAVAWTLWKEIDKKKEKENGKKNTGTDD